MDQVQEERYVFQSEWYDKQADLVRNYLLTFYPKDGTIDMVSCHSQAPDSSVLCRYSTI